jgi:zinc transport system substrate-binding protein
MRLVLALCLAGFAAGAAPARADVPKVVTDIPPVHSLVAMVMEGVGTPTLLLDTGADAHSFQLRPSKAAALADAGLVVWIGPAMTPWLERPLGNLAGGARQRVLLEAPGTVTRTFGETDEAGHDGADDGHDHAGIDPHAWLDAGNAGVWLDLIAADLSQLDSGNAALYAANADRARAAIARIDAEIAALLKPVGAHPFVVSHDALGYFAARYGLTIAGTVAAGDATAPGAAHLRDLQARMGRTDAQTDAMCIFPEANHDPRQVAALAADTGTRIGGVLDPEGTGMEPGPQVYPAILTGLADTLLACLLPG